MNIFRRYGSDAQCSLDFEVLPNQCYTALTRIDSLASCYTWPEHQLASDAQSMQLYRRDERFLETVQPKRPPSGFGGHELSRQQCFYVRSKSTPVFTLSAHLLPLVALAVVARAHLQRNERIDENNLWLVTLSALEHWFVAGSLHTSLM